jgi:hypothetical protein
VSLWYQSQLAEDDDFLLRVSACVSVEDPEAEPTVWASTYRWVMAAAPGFADAYTSAILNDHAHPGRADDVITDGMILAAVQQILAATEEPEPAPVGGG